MATYPKDPLIKKGDKQFIQAEKTFDTMPKLQSLINAVRDKELALCMKRIVCLILCTNPDASESELIAELTNIEAV